MITLDKAQKHHMQKTVGAVLWGGTGATWGSTLVLPFIATTVMLPEEFAGKCCFQVSEASAEKGERREARAR